MFLFHHSSKPSGRNLILPRPSLWSCMALARTWSSPNSAHISVVHRSGFTVTNRGCCGLGKYKGQLPCLPVVGGLCPNRNKYIFWDPFHPTQAVNELIGRRFFHGPPSDVSPMNVYQLSQLQVWVAFCTICNRAQATSQCTLAFYLHMEFLINNWGLCISSHLMVPMSWSSADHLWIYRIHGDLVLRVRTWKTIQNIVYRLEIVKDFPYRTLQRLIKSLARSIYCQINPKP